MKPRLLSPLIALGLLLNLTGCEPVVVGGAAATGVAAVHDRRTSGTVLDDQIIEFKALDLLTNGLSTKEARHVNVTSYNQMVLITGEVPEQALKQEVEEKVRAIDKVRRVHNELAVMGNADLLSRGNDTWITTQIKASFLGIKLEGFDPTRIKVVTERADVYLMGLVTHAEADAAVEQALGVSGVAKVIKIFEYLD